MRRLVRPQPLDPEPPEPVSNITGPGADWANPTRVTASDNSYTIADIPANNAVSDYLKASNFGFAIPAGAVINGITVAIERQEEFGGANARVHDNDVLLESGATVSNDRATGTLWTNADVIATYGSTSDNWGVAWTAAQINDPTFGVKLSVINTSTGTNHEARVDYIYITVAYAMPGSLNWFTVSSGGSAIGNGSPFNPVGVSGSGLLNTNTPGTYTFYAECAAAPGCRTATNFVINPSPTITGNLTICTSGNTTTQLTGSGTPAASAPWVSGTPAVATVNNTGLVTGLSAGTTIITYKDNNGCTATATVTVIQPAITGTATFCVGTTTQLTGSQTADPTTPWASSNTGVATVNNTGLVTGVAPGTSVITYKNSTGCTATSTVTINDNATITLTSTPATTSQTACINTAITPITYLIGGGGTGATVSGLPTGVTGSYNSGTKVFTISGSPSVPGTFNYTVSTTGPCIKPSATGVITVTPDATISLSSAAGTDAQTICNNSTITNISYTIGGSGTGATVSGLPAGVTGSYSGTTFTISGAPTASGTFNYTVSTTGPCVKPSANGTIVVKTIPTGTLTATEASGIAGNDNIICSGSTVTFTATPGYNSYIFRVNGTQVQSGTGNTYNTSSLINGDIITVDIANGSNCGATFGPITITVNPLPTPTLVADKNPVCAGDMVTFTATGGTGYNFKVNGISRQSGASATFTTTTLANNDAVTVDATNANGCIATSLAVFMTVNPLPTGTLTASSATICAGDNVTFTATAGAATYEFKVDGVTVQGPSATNTYSTTALTNGQVVTVIATSAASCSKTFNPVLINVNAVPTGTLTVTENSGTPNDNTICANAPVTFTFTAGFSNYNFKVNGVSQQNGASRTYVNTTLVTGDVVTVEVTNGSSCKATFTAPAITIVPSPAGTLTVSPSATICAGDNVTFTATTGYTSYNFKIGGSSVQVGAGNTFSTTTLANGNVVTVDVTNSNGCISTFGPVTMTVNPLPTGTMTPVENSGLTPDDGIICTGATVVFTAPTGFTNYDFILNGATVQSGASRTYTNSTLANGDVVKVAVTNGSSCIGLLNTITITVNPLPVVAPITGTLSVCVGNTTALADATSGGTWSSLDPSIATIDAAGVVTGVAAGTATINYTYTNTTTTGCSNTVSATVTVNALPAVSPIVGNVNMCTRVLQPIY